MKEINQYILEKFKISKDIENHDEINPDDNIKPKELEVIKKGYDNLIDNWLERGEGIEEQTNSILERFLLASIKDYCKVNASKYKDFSKMSCDFTDKGNLSIYYDGSYLGAYSAICYPNKKYNNTGYPITEKFLKKFNLFKKR